jgi:hypothetical protein
MVGYQEVAPTFTTTLLSYSLSLTMVVADREPARFVEDRYDRRDDRYGPPQRYPPNRFSAAPAPYNG